MALPAGSLKPLDSSFLSAPFLPGRGYSSHKGGPRTTRPPQKAKCTVHRGPAPNHQLH